MSQSIHTVRWLSQFDEMGWDVHLFPSLGFEIHEGLRNLTVHGRLLFPSTRIHPSVRAKNVRWLLPRNILYGQARRFCPWLVDDSRKLAKLIEQLKPDVLHSLEIQHSGYLTLHALQQCGGPVPPWIVTNWGSDTYYYSQFAHHRKKLEEVFSRCDYYDCECERDVIAARELGFSGVAFPVSPNAGGFNLEEVAALRQSGKTSERRIIAVKGYQGWSGRALTALKALEFCKDYLTNYEVKVYSPDRIVEREIRALTKRTGLRIEAVPNCTHKEMLTLHGHARISIGISASDGISTSFLEALVMGSFPIQTCTACANEWITDGESGLIVPPNDIEQIARAIRLALSDDALVDRAAEINRKTAHERLDHTQLSSHARNLYLTAARAPSCC